MFEASDPTSLLRISASSRTRYDIASNPPSEILALIIWLSIEGYQKISIHSPLISVLAGKQVVVGSRLWPAIPLYIGAWRV
jgi:hypothetical protein